MIKERSQALGKGHDLGCSPLPSGLHSILPAGGEDENITQILLSGSSVDNPDILPKRVATEADSICSSPTRGLDGIATRPLLLHRYQATRVHIFDFSKRMWKAPKILR